MATVPVRYGQTYVPGSIDKIGKSYRDAQKLAAQQEANRQAKRNEAIEKFHGLTKVEGELAPIDADIVEFGRQGLEDMFYEGVEKDPNYLNSREFQKALREFEMGVDTAKKLSGTTYDAHKMIVDTPVNDRFIEWDGEDIDRIQGADTVYNSLKYQDDDTLKTYTDLGFLGALNKRASDLKGVSKIDGTPEFGVVETGRRVGQEIANEFLKDPEIRGQLKVNTQGPVTTWEVWSKLDPEQQTYMEEQIWGSKKVQDAVKMDMIAGRDVNSPEYKEKKMADIMEMIRMSSLDSGQYETEQDSNSMGSGTGNDQWSWIMSDSRTTKPDETGYSYVVPQRIVSLSRIDQGENKAIVIPDARSDTKDKTVLGRPLRIKESLTQPGKWTLEIEEAVPVLNTDGKETGEFEYKVSELPYTDEVAAKIKSHTAGKKGGGFDLEDFLSQAKKGEDDNSEPEFTTPNGYTYTRSELKDAGWTDEQINALKQQ